jgi:hypothetical protein
MNFRCHIDFCSKICDQPGFAILVCILIFAVDGSSKSKIGDHQVKLIVEQEILSFEVAMGDIIFMTIVQPC